MDLRIVKASQPVVIKPEMTNIAFHSADPKPKAPRKSAVINARIIVSTVDSGAIHSPLPSLERFRFKQSKVLS